MNSLLKSQNLCLSVSKVIVSPSSSTTQRLNNLVCLQCVRWSRHKPRWLPMAKTKLYRIPERKRHPVDEHDEVLRLFNSYRTDMKAIQLYLSRKLESLTTAPEVIAEQQRLLDEDHAKSFQINDEWNKEVAKAREKRIAEEIEQKRLEALQKIQEYKNREIEELEKFNQLVRLEKERSKSFITPENIDEAIEKVLSETVDHNYCIDLNGNVYKGFHARPGVVE